MKLGQGYFIHLLRCREKTLYELGDMTWMPDKWLLFGFLRFESLVFTRAGTNPTIRAFGSSIFGLSISIEILDFFRPSCPTFSRCLYDLFSRYIAIRGAPVTSIGFDAFLPVHTDDGDCVLGSRCVGTDCDRFGAAFRRKRAISIKYFSCVLVKSMDIALCEE